MRMDSIASFSFFDLSISKSFARNFQVSVEASTRVLSRLPNLRYIASETWVGSTSINLFRALAFELRNIKTFHIEHNCIFHPFIGDFVKFQSELVDQYMTFGWVSPESKFVSLGSLFPFKIPKKKLKYEILYVSYSAEQYRAVYSTSYGQLGAGAISHINFVREFFSALSKDIIEKISYRGYPKDYFITGLRYNKEKALELYLKDVTFVSSFKNTGESCKEQMAASRLVIVDKMSTAYLESLMMNIPTICFWDSEAIFKG